jgi:hypothetical protein
MVKIIWQSGHEERWSTGYLEKYFKKLTGKREIEDSLERFN